MKILTSYILKRIEVFFFLTLSILVFFFLINKTIGLLSYFKFFQFKLIDLIKLLLFSLPHTIESLFGFCGLLAVILAFKQFSNNFETAAIFAHGISVNFLFRIVFFFGLTLMIFGFIIISWIRPVFLDQSWKLKQKIIANGEFKFLEQNFNLVGNFIFYYNQKQNEVFLDIILLQNKNPLTNKIITAKKAKIKSSIAEEIFIFSFEEGQIISLPESTNNKESQLLNFKKLQYPIKLTNTIQFGNLSNKVLKNDQTLKRHDRLTMLELLEKVKTHQPNSKEYNYYLARSIFLLTRSLHNLALPLLGVFLAIFIPRFPIKWSYLKFFVMFIIYNILVVQVEELILNGKIAVWWSFGLPLVTICSSYFFFTRKFN